MPKTLCSNCNTDKVDIDPVTNSTVCTICGFVIDDGGVVSDIQFEENAHGSSSVVGQFVSVESKGPCGNGVPNSRDSRELTINKARKFIQAVGEHLRLSSQCQNVALNFFKMALSGNLTRGRKSSYLYGACMYMACRLERTSHLLIDFADHMQVSFTQLGRTFIDISSALSIYMPVMDPSVYILRFVNQMNLGNKLNDVASTALRILRRMKKDMIECGRQPSGLCGAALYIAARFHNFKITIGDIVKIVHITHNTLKKRLIEFTDTPSSLLTVDKFLEVDLPEMQDPPSFKKGQNHKFKLHKSLRTKKCGQKFVMIERLIEKALDAKKQRKNRFGFLGSIGEISGMCAEGSSKVAGKAESVIDNIAMGTALDCIENIVNDEESISDVSEVDTSTSKGIGPTWEIMGMWESADEPINPEGFEEIDDNSSEDLDDLDDDEINSYILTPANMEAKAKAWYEVNGDFMAKQKERKEKAIAESPDNKVIKKRKRNAPILAATAEEAVESVIREKKLSDKINYDILDGLDINVFCKLKEAKDIADSMQKEQIDNEPKEDIDVTVNEDCCLPVRKYSISDIEKSLKIAPFKKSSTNMPTFRSHPFDFENTLDDESAPFEKNKKPNILDAVIKHSIGNAWRRNAENTDVRGTVEVIEQNGNETENKNKLDRNKLPDEVQSVLKLLNRKDKLENMLHLTTENSNAAGKMRKKSEVKRVRKKTMKRKLITSELWSKEVAQKKRKLSSTMINHNKLIGSDNGDQKKDNDKTILTEKSETTLNEEGKKTIKRMALKKGDNITINDKTNSTTRNKLPNKTRTQGTRIIRKKKNAKLFAEKLGGQKSINEKVEASGKAGQSLSTSETNDIIINKLPKKTKMQGTRKIPKKKNAKLLEEKLGGLKSINEKDKSLDEAGQSSSTSEKDDITYIIYTRNKSPIKTKKLGTINIPKKKNDTLLAEKLGGQKSKNKKVKAPGKVGKSLLTSETKVVSRDVKAVCQEQTKGIDPKSTRSYKYCHKSTFSNALEPAVSISFVNNDEKECTTANQPDGYEQLTTENMGSIENTMNLVKQDLSNIPANHYIVPSTNFEFVNTVIEGECAMDVEVDDYEEEDEEYNVSDYEDGIISMQDALMKHNRNMSDMPGYDY